MVNRHKRKSRPRKGFSDRKENAKYSPTAPLKQVIGQHAEDLATSSSRLSRIMHWSGWKVVGIISAIVTTGQLIHSLISPDPPPSTYEQVSNIEKKVDRIDENTSQYSAPPSAEEVIKELGITTKEAGRTVASKLRQADELSRRGLHVQAEEIYAALCRLYPDIPALIFNLAYANQRIGHLNKAAEMYVEVLAQDSSNVDVYNNLGGILFSMKRTNEAIANYQRAIAIDPDFKLAHYNLAIALTDQGNIDQAMSEYRKATGFAAAHNNLARLLLISGHRKEAIEQLRIAIEIDPSIPEAHYNLCRALFEEGMSAGAEPECIEATRLNPRYASAYHLLGTVLESQGKINQAIEAHKRATQIDSTVAGYHTDLGSVLRLANRLDEAIGEHLAAIELDPYLTTARYNLGVAWLIKKDYTKAVQAFSDVLALDSTHLAARVNLAKAYALLGKPFEAVEQYKRFLQFAPDTGFADPKRAATKYIQRHRSLK